MKSALQMLAESDPYIGKIVAEQREHYLKHDGGGSTQDVRTEQGRQKAMYKRQIRLRKEKEARKARRR